MIWSVLPWWSICVAPITCFVAGVAGEFLGDLGAGIWGLGWQLRLFSPQPPDPGPRPCYPAAAPPTISDISWLIAACRALFLTYFSLSISLFWLSLAAFTHLLPAGGISR